MTSARRRALLAAALILTGCATFPSPTPTLTGRPTPTPVPAPASVPTPRLAFVGTEDYQTTYDGLWHTRYLLTIENWADYPPELFERSTSYPCEPNPVAVRAVVEIRDSTTHGRLFGFCQLEPSNLTEIWFAVPQGSDPPPHVEVWLFDQLTRTYYRSNVIALPGG